MSCQDTHTGGVAYSGEQHVEYSSSGGVAYSGEQHVEYICL